MSIDFYPPRSGRVLKENSEFINIADLIVAMNRSAIESRQTLSDQAGRNRSSLPIPLGDYKLIFSRLPQFFDTVTAGTATVDYNAARRSHHLQTVNSGDYAIVQTFQSHNYFAGKSQFVEITSFAFDDIQGIEKRYGYYNSGKVAPFQTGLDGFYLYTDGTTHYLRIVNNGTDILNIQQSEWDDPLDGTGDSGYTINWANFNVFQFSFLWLGGTGLRFSIVVGSRIIQVYEYIHVGSVNANNLIFSRPSKPIRMELIQTGADAGSFEPVCSTVITEGSEASGNIGEVLSISSPAANTVQLSYPNRGVVKGLRLKSDCLCTIVDVVGIDTFATTTNDFYKWELVLKPSLVDADGNPKALTFTDINGNAVQEATGDGATFAVGGIVIESGFGSSRSAISTSIESARKIGSSIDGVPEEIYLIIAPLQGTTNIQVFGSINIKAFV